MSRTRLFIASVIIVVIVLITFALSVPHTRDIEVSPVLLPETESTPPSVALSDSLKKGIHTISGSIEAPNACTPVSALATLTGSASSTQGILVTISLEPDSGICLQLPTRVGFQTTVSAPGSLPITATVNGSPAVITSL